MKTTATRDDDDYVINGSKMWITNAEQAGFFIVSFNSLLSLLIIKQAPQICGYVTVENF